MGGRQDVSGSSNTTFSQVLSSLWAAQETLLSPRDASEKPKRAQISPIRLLAAQYWDAGSLVCLATMQPV